MIVQTKVRKWGNSIGIVIPKEIADQERLNEGEEIVIELKSKQDISDVFGLLKDWKKDTQKIKNELKKGWSK